MVDRRLLMSFKKVQKRSEPLLRERKVQFRANETMTFNDCGEELMVSIFKRLSSQDTAMCAKVCTSWRSAVNTLNSSYFWYRSAMSHLPVLRDAMEELLEDVQAGPFWPNFAIIFAGDNVDLTSVSRIVKRRLPESLSLIACNTIGVMGKDVVADFFDEEPTEAEDVHGGRWTPHHISLSVGRFPGVSVKALRMNLGYFSVKALKMTLCHFSGTLMDLQVERFVSAARGLQGQAPLAMLLLVHPIVEKAVVEKLLKTLEVAYGKDSTIGAFIAATSHQPQGLLVHVRGESSIYMSRDEASSSNDLTSWSSVLRTTRNRTFMSSASSDRLEDHESDAEDTLCSVAALAFMEDPRTESDPIAGPGKKLKCAVVASGVLIPDHLVPKGPVFDVNYVVEFFDPYSRSLCLYLGCRRDGRPESIANIFSDWGPLTHVSRVGVPDEKELLKYYRAQRVRENENVLRVDGCSRRRIGQSLQFHSPNQSLALESMDGALSSFARANPTANLVGALMFSTSDYHCYKDMVYGSRNQFREYFPHTPLAGATCHDQYGPPTFVTSRESAARKSLPEKIICFNKRKALFCCTMFFIFYTEDD